MQINQFHNGGYVIHKIEGYWRGKVSAWFDSDARLLDAEQITRPFGPSRSVKRGGPMWQEIQRIGHREKHIPHPWPF